ncbi:MAG: oxidoreductase [Amycolatopsis sp.]|uniref:ferredoxin--NADP reductase n=1 Tax=Amycolatopsis sp. TaxID=37632 RepID=UPI002628C8EE|nr:ferredoxin--NADP reductase [Amycolatopsis sp.]MCU1687684.1 oxidoreductase [Amycolatopsis sp.]
MAEPDFHRLTVAEVVDETRGARSIVFAIPPELEETFRYKPGQFLTLRIPSEDGGSMARCYSFSSAPHEGLHKVTIKQTGGYGSRWVCEQLHEGAEIDVLPPAGAFTPKTLDADFLFLAAGSGVTPVMSIVKSVLERGTGRITLVYANRDDQQVIFADELTALAHRHADRLVVVHWLESVQGLPSTALLRTLVEPFAGRQAFVCGPGPFMDAAKDALEALGLPRRQVHVERFVSLTGNPFEEPPAAPEETEAPASVRVDLDGVQRQLDWPRQTKLLDLLLNEGLDAPYSCRQGQCGACTCRITAGEVKMLDNDVLDAEDIADGFILACQSLPLTDEVTVSYE